MVGSGSAEDAVDVAVKFEVVVTNSGKIEVALNDAEMAEAEAEVEAGRQRERAPVHVREGEMSRDTDRGRVRPVLPWKD